MLTLRAGSFAQTGNTVLLRVGNRMPADSGAFSLSVYDVTITKVMTADLISGSFLYSGFDVKIRGWLEPFQSAEVYTVQQISDETWTEQSVISETWTEAA